MLHGRRYATQGRISNGYDYLCHKSTDSLWQVQSATGHPTLDALEFLRRAPPSSHRRATIYPTIKQTEC